MERVFDELTGLQRTQPRWNWRTAAIAWALRLTGYLMAGLAIGAGIEASRWLAG